MPQAQRPHARAGTTHRRPIGRARLGAAAAAAAGGGSVRGLATRHRPILRLKRVVGVGGEAACGPDHRLASVRPLRCALAGARFPILLGGATTPQNNAARFTAFRGHEHQSTLRAGLNHHHTPVRPSQRVVLAGGVRSLEQHRQRLIEAGPLQHGTDDEGHLR
jgi:hypothetical protein